ncbi:hypothetical protein KSF78_0007730 [Schistosoma japonicum]|nr:hypothetical protein KSF78_0007730 [Schistosoma japonicum]
MCALQLGILPELEKSADGIAQHLELLLHSLKSTLNQMSSLTLDCTTVFSDSVDYTCETVNSCIKINIKCLLNVECFNLLTY